MDSEKHYNERLTSEMIHIIKQKNGLYKQNDTEFLLEVYILIIDVVTSRPQVSFILMGRKNWEGAKEGRN